MRAAAPTPVDGTSAVAVGALAVAALAAAATQPWPLVLSLLIAPALEETVFRAGLQDRLLHRGAAPWLSNLLTALAFGAMHLLLRGASLHAASVFVPALLIGTAYNRWRRLRVCIALHMAMNALWIALHHLQ